MIVWLAISAALGALAATAPLRWAVAIVVFCIPFNGTAAMMMGPNPLLLPVVVTLGFLARHAFTLLIRTNRTEFLGILRTDAPMLALILYCVISGLFFPRVFESTTYVTSQDTGISTPLGPWLISMPQLGYLTFAAWLYLALRHSMLREGLAPLLYGVLAQVLFVGGFGALQAMLGMVGVSIPTEWIVNNTAYALLVNVVENGFVRVTSVFVEASSFGQWGGGALAFCYALYVNGVRPKLALGMTVLMGATLLLSTSSTSYFALAVVGLFAAIHAGLDPDPRRRDRAMLVLAAGAFVAAVALIIVFSAESGFLYDLRRMILVMTVEKNTSSSAIERGAWAMRSIQNAQDTHFLGVGYGAARSSGLIVSMFGMVGLPGLALMFVTFGGLALRAFRRVRTAEDAVASAGAFGLVGSLAAMGLSAPDLSLANMIWVFAAIAAAPLEQRAAARDAANRAAALDVRGAERPA